MIDTRNMVALFLCDLTGVMAQPWREAGYQTIQVDPQHEEGFSMDGSITKVGRIIDHPETWRVVRWAIQDGNVAFVAGFPPCTDLAVSGARWFDSKREKDPAFQFKAMHVVWQCQIIGELSGAPWFAENPISQISSLWRRPDHTFHPYQFTGLAENDNYTKQTCLWTGGNFVMPAENMHPSVASAVELVKATCGRMVPKRKAMEALPDNELVARWYPDNRIHDCPPSDERTNIRSATPEGFAKAVFLANAPHLRETA